MSDGIRIELALRLTPAILGRIRRKLVAREQREEGVTWRYELAGFDRKHREEGIVDLGSRDD